MRLTKKQKNRLSSHGFRECDYLLNGTPKTQALNKLGQLEDIEDELGIDLITLFKARNCIFRIYETSNYKGKEEIKVCETRYPQIDILRKTICTFYKFEDYGKTWALTKEELEK